MTKFTYFMASGDYWTVLSVSMLAFLNYWTERGDESSSRSKSSLEPLRGESPFFIMVFLPVLNFCVVLMTRTNCSKKSFSYLLSSAVSPIILGALSLRSHTIFLMVPSFISWWIGIEVWSSPSLPSEKTSSYFFRSSTTNFYHGSNFFITIFKCSLCWSFVQIVVAIL